MSDWQSTILNVTIQGGIRRCSRKSEVSLKQTRTPGSLPALGNLYAKTVCSLQPD